jgi:acyl-CoA synthetase (AMP-forming)/AMP-acid ligase II
VLREHPEVADAVVIGVADGTWGQVPLAVVVARASSRPDLRPFIEGRLASYKVPRIVYADEIPRLANGKPDRAAVRALYGQAERK